MTTKSNTQRIAEAVAALSAARALLTECIGNPDESALDARRDVIQSAIHRAGWAVGHASGDSPWETWEAYNWLSDTCTEYGQGAEELKRHLTEDDAHHGLTSSLIDAALDEIDWEQLVSALQGGEA